MNALKFLLSQRKFWLFLIATLALNSKLFNLPIQAATINNSSLVNISLDQFNRVPESVAILTDVKATSIAEIGIVQSVINIDSKFSAVPSVFAYSNLQSNIFARGSVYSVRNDITSLLVGSFFIPARESLKFNFSTNLSLNSSKDSLQDSSSSTSGQVSLYLQDILHNRVLDIFQVTAGLNTNPVDRFDQNFFELQLSPNITLTNYYESQNSGGMTESFQTNFSGIFEKYFEESTSLALVISTSSCSYGSNVVGACITVSEPSNRFALIFLLGFIAYHSRIMNQVVKFTFQPFLKHFINNLLLGIRR